ncbi:Modification methylase Eco57IB [Usitatibacter rugosus]|uniref:site-specific DNA-methyltransferase (adenine-specific) n=2 Tax=Usitatibacter rugosus TaxID=2732067 RepID=A0A6M4GUU6_9PROT|nr:Modification methylase Eco57IB [Usitatibacter rugosus]
MSAAAIRLRELGAAAPVVSGVDIHAESVRVAAELLRQHGAVPNLYVGDFFAQAPEPKFGAVIGNPPYVRYQQFSGEARTAALEAALRQGVRLTGLASSWAAFTVHAAAFLAPGGRLGLVLPAELLSVNYAAEIRRFLLKRFRSVRLVLFEQLIFPGVLEDVVLLLAEGEGGADRFEVFQARNADDLASIANKAWTGYLPKGNEKWTQALISGASLEAYEKVTLSNDFEVMLDWGETYLGAVTGNNDYFTLTRARAQSLKLPPSELVRISPPGSQHHRGLVFTEAGWEALARAGKACYLFAPKDELSAGARRLVASGEKTKVDDAYKCRMRSPWFKVPLVKRPDLIFTYMNHDRPRLLTNAANVHVLNSLYGVSLAAKRREIGRELLPIAMLNSASLLGAEIVGRSYGGGMLKHEPKEVDKLPMPSLALLKAAKKRLTLLAPQVAAYLRQADIAPAVEIIDRVLFTDILGYKADEVAALRAAREHLMQRRYSRAKG